VSQQQIKTIGWSGEKCGKFPSKASAQKIKDELMAMINYRNRFLLLKICN
jgi:hypothetical protein